MKNQITLTALMIILFASCQSDKEKAAHRAYDSIMAVTAKFNKISEMELRYISNMNTEDAKNKLILEIGQDNYDWYIATGNKLHDDIKKEDSIERRKLDSMKHK